MKALSKKSLILVLSLVFALSALMFAFSFKNVKAETETGVGTFEVMEGAQIRIGGAGASGSGLRFRVKMDYQTASYVKANENVTMGFIITPKYYFDNRTASTDGAEIAYSTDDYFYSIEKYVEKDSGGIKVDENKIYISDDSGIETVSWDGVDDAATPLGKSYYVNGAIKDMLEENLDREYCVVAYIYDGTEYFYAVTDHDFARTYKQVASKAYLSGKNSLSIIQKADNLQDIGSTQNPIQIADTSDFENLANGISRQNGYQGVNFNLQKDIDLGAGDGADVENMLSGFSGKITANAGVTIDYVSSSGNVELAEDGVLPDGVYNCVTGKTLTTNVLSFNMRFISSDDTGNNSWSSRSAAFMDYLYNQDATVIAMQEVDANQYYLIKATFDAKENSRWNMAWHYRTSTYSQGLMILYDNTVWKKLSENIFWLSDTPDVRNTKYSGTSYPRPCVNMLLEHKETGAKLNVFNVHLENDDNEQSIAARENGIQLVMDRATAAGYAHFITGDFNTNNTSNCYDIIAASMKDAQATAPITESGRTYNGWSEASTAGKAIDFCFVSDGIAPLTFDILDQDRWTATDETENLYSDHYAIKTKIRLTYALDTAPSDASAFVKEISTAEEYNSFVESTDKNTYTGTTVKFTQNFAFDEFKTLLNNFNGKFAFADGVKLNTSKINAGNVKFRYRDGLNQIIGSSIVNAADLSITGKAPSEQIASFRIAAARIAQIDLDPNMFDLTDKTHLRIYLATDTPTSITGHIQYSDGNAHCLLGNTKLTTLEETGVWKEYLIPIEDVLAHYATYGHLRFLRLSVSGAPGYGNVYVGGIEFINENDIETEPLTQIPEITADTDWLKCYTSGGNINGGSIVAKPTTITGGDFNGNYVWHRSNAAVFYVAEINPNDYDLTNYTHLSLWIAASTPTALTSLQFSNTQCIIGAKTITDINETGKWINYQIPIADVIAHYETYNRINILRTTTSSSYEGTVYFYIGGLEFVSVDSRPTQLPELSMNLLKHYNTSLGATESYHTFIEDAQALGFAGGYTGTSAIRFNSRIAIVGIVANLEEYNLAGYTHLSVWVAAGNTDGASTAAVQVSSSAGVGCYATVAEEDSAYVTGGNGSTLSVTAAANYRWIQIYIPIEKLSSFVATDANGNGIIKLFRQASKSGYVLYVGDVQFVNLTENT